MPNRPMGLTELEEKATLVVAVKLCPEALIERNIDGWCRAVYCGYLCTRPKGHPGLHISWWNWEGRYQEPIIHGPWNESETERYEQE